MFVSVFQPSCCFSMILFQPIYKAKVVLFFSKLVPVHAGDVISQSVAVTAFATLPVSICQNLSPEQTQQPCSGQQVPSARDKYGALLAKMTK